MPRLPATAMECCWLGASAMKRAKSSRVSMGIRGEVVASLQMFGYMNGTEDKVSEDNFFVPQRPKLSLAAACALF